MECFRTSFDLFSPYSPAECGALQDYSEAIRLKPNYAIAFNNRGVARSAKGDIEGALQDFNEAVRLGYKP